MYVIKKHNLYVSQSGRSNSYTTRLQYAQTFRDAKTAAQNKCGNEYVARLESELNR